MTKPSGRGVDAPKRDVFLMEPYKLLVHGVDDADDDHLLSDRDKSRLTIEPTLLASIRVHGVVVTVEAINREGGSWIVYGRRRVMHARVIWDEQEEAKVPESERIRIKTFFVRGEDLHLFFRARVENSSRLEETAMARGRAAALAIAKGASEADVALSFSCDVKTVKGWLQLIEAADPVRRAVDNGKISASAGMQIAKLKTNDEQRAALAELIAKGKPTTDAARRVVARAKTGTDTGGVISRRVLRALRDEVAAPDESADADSASWQAGFASALSIVLGDGMVDATAQTWLARTKKKLAKKPKEAKDKSA